MPRIEINNKRYEYDMDPDHCPLCHHGIMPSRIAASNILREVINGDVLQIVFLCPRKECQRLFIGMYFQNYGYHRHFVEGPHLLTNTAPYRARIPDVPDEIKRLSPNYVELLSQSEAAEAYQLDQIAGAGFRKALEFIIKDFAIRKNPDKEDEIKKAFLANCINNFLDDANVKECAKRATWLGNDETHYIRKWEEKDINDLKILIRLTQAWILNSLLTERYLADMR